MVFDSLSGRGRLTGMEFHRDVDPKYHLPEIIQRLSAMGARDTIVELWLNATEANQLQSFVALARGVHAEQVYDALAHVGLTDLVLQLGAHMHCEVIAVLALIKAGYIDDAMHQAPRLTNMNARYDIMRALKEKERYDLVDTLCRQWFGFPPPRKFLGFYLTLNSPFVTHTIGEGISTFKAVLDDWAVALDQLGNHQDARAIRGFCKQEWGKY